MTHRCSTAALAAGLLLAGAAHADALGDLRKRLGEWRPVQPLQATLDVNSSVHDDDDPKKDARAQLQVSVASDADGLHIVFPPALLQRASREQAANARDKDAPTPLGDLLGLLSPVSVQPMVDFAPELLHKLDGAALTRERDEPHDGKPSHLLVLDEPLPPSAAREMTIKHYTGQLSVWLALDGTPVEMQEAISIKGRKLLVSIEFGTTSRYVLRRLGPRLVASSRHVEETHSVFGSTGGSVIDATLVTP